MSKSYVKPAPLGIAALLVGLTFTCVQRALAVVTVPNEVQVAYTLAAGSSSAAIVPITNHAVSVMGVCTTLGFRGVGQVAMLHIQGSFLEWTGINSPSNGTITSNFSGSAGTQIVQLDFSGGVNLVVSGPDSFVVTNSSSGTRAGVVTLIY
jgi:hypothetical protein